jgi:hypothetical protein
LAFGVYLDICGEMDRFFIDPGKDGYMLGWINRLLAGPEMKDPPAGRFRCTPCSWTLIDLHFVESYFNRKLEVWRGVFHADVFTMSVRAIDEELARLGRNENGALGQVEGMPPEAPPHEAPEPPPGRPTADPPPAKPEPKSKPRSLDRATIQLYRKIAAANEDAGVKGDKSKRQRVAASLAGRIAAVCPGVEPEAVVKRALAWCNLHPAPVRGEQQVGRAMNAQQTRNKRRQD